MIQTSKDLLFIVIAIAIAWLTIFLSIILYYFFTIVRQGSKIAKDWQERFNKIDVLINLVREKIVNSAFSFVALAEAIKQIKDFIKSKKEARKKNK